MFYIGTLVCFFLGLALPFRRLEHWDPPVMGPILLCSFVCAFFLLLQMYSFCRYGNGLFWGRMFILWSIFHMLAALIQLAPMMLEHFLWIFAATCLQMSDQLIYDQI